MNISIQHLCSAYSSGLLFPRRVLWDISSGPKRSCLFFCFGFYWWVIAPQKFGGLLKDYFLLLPFLNSVAKWKQYHCSCCQAKTHVFLTVDVKSFASMLFW